MSSAAARNPLRIKLLVEPAHLTLAERDDFRLGVTATNTSDTSIDPQLFALRLLVDGEVSPAFDLAIGNGVTPAGWDMLAAGATTQPHYWRLGAALFEEPGEFHLVLRLDLADRPRLESAATLQVTP